MGSTRFKGVLFDLDNTLINRRESILMFSEKLLKKFKLDNKVTKLEDIYSILLEKDCGGYVSRKIVFSEFIDLISWMNKPSLEAVIEFWNTEFPFCSVLFPGVYEVLEKLKANGLKIGIVTNGSKDFQNNKIDFTGIRKYMDTILISDEVGFRKPEKKIFNLSLELMHLKNNEVCFVGDNPHNDILGARDCGIAGIWYKGFFNWPQKCKAPDFEITEFREIEKILF